MPVAMSKQQKKPSKNKHIKAELAKELGFIKNVFSLLVVPMQPKVDYEDDLDDEVVDVINENKDKKETHARAHSITELEEKLAKVKSQNKFTLKNKLVKKSLSSKLNKKIKKRERVNKTKEKPRGDAPMVDKTIIENKNNVNISKPVFNNDGKLVFSKFDFANDKGRDRSKKTQSDPKKLLDNLKQQQEKIRHLEETEVDKATVIKEKVAWKTVLQKAEGQKVKDDPTLLKKSIKRLEQKKKQSKKQWDNRISNVKQKKEERQKKRSDNISKKKKEKKSKIVKASIKRGRVVI